MAWKLGIYFVFILAVAVQIAAAINKNGTEISTDKSSQFAIVYCISK